jgi:hypothetical protein
MYVSTNRSLEGRSFFRDCCSRAFSQRLRSERRRDSRVREPEAETARSVIFQSSFQLHFFFVKNCLRALLRLGSTDYRQHRNSLCQRKAKKGYFPNKNSVQFNVRCANGKLSVQQRGGTYEASSTSDNSELNWLRPK